MFFCLYLNGYVTSWLVIGFGSIRPPAPPSPKLIIYLLFQCKPVLLFYPFAFVVPTVFIRDERRTNVLWSAAFTVTTAQRS